MKKWIHIHIVHGLMNALHIRFSVYTAKVVISSESGGWEAKTAQHKKSFYLTTQFEIFCCKQTFLFLIQAI